MVESFILVIAGSGVTEINTVSVSMQPGALYPVTMYCVLVNTFAMGLLIVGLLRPTDGDQL